MMTWVLDKERKALLSKPVGFSIALYVTSAGRFYTLWENKDRVKQLGPVALDDEAGKESVIDDLKALANGASRTQASSNRT